MPTAIGTSISVCVDCYVTEANGYAPEEWGYVPECEPLSLITEPVVTSGCLDDGPECEGHGFSWWACQGCGSTLGGERYPITVWDE